MALNPSKPKRFELRVSAYEKEAWEKAAGGAGLVSEWLRSLANAACAEPKVGFDHPLPKVTPPDCARAHFHRPGVYCGSCGKVN